MRKVKDFILGMLVAAVLTVALICVALVFL